MRTEVFTEVKSNIQNAQAKQRLYYDCKHARTGFQLGDHVLLRNMINLACKGGKLDKEWSSPYAIDELCGKGLYREWKDTKKEVQLSPAENISTKARTSSCW